MSSENQLRSWVKSSRMAWFSRCREQPVFLFFLVVGIGLRLWHLGDQSLWLDEAWSWAAARMSIQDIFALPALDPHPPLYYLLLKSWLIAFPQTESGLRLLSVACSVLTMLGVAWLAGHWVNRRAAILVLALAAVSSFDLYYAQEARMYVLMAGLWVLSYFLLCESLEGRAVFFILWGLANLLLALTHVYGLLVVAVEILFLIGLYSWRYWASRDWRFLSPELCVGLALSCSGLICVIVMTWHALGVSAGGAWIPQLSDLIMLFNLITIGIGAARIHFLDGSHLILPALTSIPDWMWLGVGSGLIGLPLAKGLWVAMRSGGAMRQRSLLGLAMFVLPAAIAFAYAFLLRYSAWAFKPFLGMAYLVYLWAGIGVSKLSSSLLRCAMVVALCSVALVSIIPYFTQWQKSNARLVWRSMPVSETVGLVVVHPSYSWMVAQYYLGDTAIVVGVERDAQGAIHLVRRSSLLDPGTVMDCSKLEAFKVVRVYSMEDDPRTKIPQWFECLRTQTWLFENEQWILLHD